MATCGQVVGCEGGLKRPKYPAGLERVVSDASVELSIAVAPGMKLRGWGRILTIGSIKQNKPEPDLAIYAALKSVQHNLSINLARDLAPFRVTMNTLAPGLIATARNSWRRVDAQK